MKATMKKLAMAFAAMAATVGFAGDSAPFLLDTAEGTRIAREVETIAYSTEWNGGAMVRVAADGVTLKKATAPASGDVVWNAAQAGVGCHTLTHTAGAETLTAQFTMLGDDVAVHAGTLGTSETWGPDKVHLITSALTVPSVVSLTIEPGAIVKFMPGTSLTVESGGNCTAQGVIFTHVNDDTVGGDTLCDGEDAQPVMGDYKITGNITDNDDTEYRYMPPQTLTSSISSNTRLRGYRMYIASNSVTVASGATLTLQPGTIIKFNTGCSLTVNGTLDAQGTRAAPVVFTSLKDDEHGGDTNGDGDLTCPYYNDWKYVVVSGTANMKYVTMMYGGGASNSSESGMLIGQSGGIIFLDCCTLAHALYDGIFSRATVTGNNTIIYDCDRGINTCGGSGVFKNCVIDSCRWGVMAEGGSGTYYNCIITRFFGSNAWPTGWGVAYWSGSLKTYNCCVWSTLQGASNYRSSPTAVNNISSDPRFIDPDNGNFQIAEDSPCIDAGDSSVAPEFDYFGQPRDGEADIGICEVVGAHTTGYDLAAVAVNALAARSTIGDTLSISYDAANVGRLAVSDPWHDAFYLVSASSGKTYALGEILNPGGLDAGETRTYTSQFKLPVVPVGEYSLRLVVNSRRMDVPEGSATENNSVVSEAKIVVASDSIDISAGASGRVAAGASAVCEIAIPAGSGDKLLRVKSASGGTSLSARSGLGFLPVDASSGVTLSFSGGEAWLSVPAGTEKVWLVLDNAGVTEASYEVDSHDGSLALLGVSPSNIPSSGEVTLEISGAGFTDGCEVSFVGAGTIAPLAVRRVSSGLLSATVDAAAFSAGGVYSVVVGKGAETKRLDNALTVAKAAGKPKFWAKLDVPSSMRQGRLVSTCFIEYGNSGTADMLAPVVQVSLTGDGTLGYIDGLSGLKTLQFVAAGDAGSAGILRAGSSHRIRFAVRAGASNKISLHTSEGSTYAPVPWTNAADYLADLSAAATRISLRGQDATDYEEVQSLARRVKAGEMTAVIYGRLTDSDGSAIAGAILTFSNQNSGVTLQVATDAVGYFVTGKVADGDFLVECDKIPLDGGTPHVRVSEGGDAVVTLKASDSKVVFIGAKCGTQGLVATATEINLEITKVGLAKENGFEFRGLQDGIYRVEIYKEESLVYFAFLGVVNGESLNGSTLEYDGKGFGTLELSASANLAGRDLVFVVFSVESGYLNFVFPNGMDDSVRLDVPAGEYNVFFLTDDSEKVSSNNVEILSGKTNDVIFAETKGLQMRSKAKVAASLKSTDVFESETDLLRRAKQAYDKALQQCRVPLVQPIGDRDCVHNRHRYEVWSSYRKEYGEAFSAFSVNYVQYQIAIRALGRQSMRTQLGVAQETLKAALEVFLIATGNAEYAPAADAVFAGTDLAIDAVFNGEMSLETLAGLVKVVGDKGVTSAIVTGKGLGEDFALKKQWEERVQKLVAVLRDNNLPIMEEWNERFERFLIDTDNYAYLECCPMILPEMPYDLPVDNKTPSVPKSWDPNEMVGPEGVGEARYVKPGDWMKYTIYFENKAGFNIADAQEIKVTNQLNEWLDWSTFEMREVSFNNQNDVGLDGLANGISEVQMTGANKYVRTTVECDTQNGVVTWYMRVYDPNGDIEGFPMDGSGFLPSNDDTHRGEGYIKYRIKLRADAPANVKIVNSATIVFDYNDPIETDPAWWNTVAGIAHVTMSVDGVEKAMDLIVGLQYGENFPVDPAPRTGHSFGGWWTAPNGSNGTGRRVTSESLVMAGDSGLYAYWTANPYKVHFNANGGTGTMPDQSFVYGTAQKLSANAFTRKMYAFGGWALSSNGAAVCVDGQTVSNLSTAANSVVTLYAVWERTKYELWPEGIGGAAPAAMSEYNGYVVDAAGNVKGTVQVKVGKPNAKTGLAAVKGSLLLNGAKKVNLKAFGNGKVKINANGPTEIQLVGGETVVVTLAANGMSGKLGGNVIDGARNFFTSKDKAEANAANALIEKWIGSLAMIWDGGNANVTIAKKGKAKVKGTLSSGTKLSASAQLLVGEKWLCVPVSVPKANLSFVLWLPRGTGNPAVVGLGDGAVVGKAGTLKAGAKFSIDKSASIWKKLPGTVLTTYLPNGVSVTQNGMKWVLPKAGKIAMKRGALDVSKAGENPSGLKLSYKKDGTFKGSFKVYSDVGGKLKGTTVSVTGVVIGSTGYGTATIKGAGSIAISVE